MTIEELASHIQMMNDLKEIEDALTRHQSIIWYDVKATHNVESYFGTAIPPELKFEFIHPPIITSTRGNSFIHTALCISCKPDSILFSYSLFRATLLCLDFTHQDGAAWQPRLSHIIVSVKLSTEIWTPLAVTLRMNDVGFKCD